MAIEISGENISVLTSVIEKSVVYFYISKGYFILIRFGKKRIIVN